MLPQFQYMAETWAQRVKNVIFKTPRELVKRLFEVTTTKQNKRMKMQKISHFKPVRASLKTLKRGPCDPPPKLVIWPWHIVMPPCASRT